MKEDNKEIAKEKKLEVNDEGLGLAGSEFYANQDIVLHHDKNLLPCTSDWDGAIAVNLKEGDKIPELFVPLLLVHQRNYMGVYKEIAGKTVFVKKFPEKDGLPDITPEQEKKYGVSFRNMPPEKPKMKYHAEGLSRKWNELGAKEFKVWAEKEFGADKIDRRKSPRQIINEILSWF